MKVKKGQWYTYCCEQDLTMAENDEELNDDLCPQIWENKESALIDISIMWLRSANKNPDNNQKKGMIQNAINCIERLSN